jgi:hypothetical protein
MVNRNIAVALLLAALVPVPAAAQNVGGGVKAGVVFADVPKLDEFTDLSGTDVRVGFSGGGFLTWSLNPTFAVQPEVLFTQKGAKQSGSESGIDYEFDVEVWYLEVPVLARANFGGGAARGYVFGGPSFNFKLDARASTDIAGESEEEDIGEDVESFEFALVFGGGAEFGRFLVEGRWIEGLTNVAKDEEEDVMVDLKTRTFAILFGVRF